MLAPILMWVRGNWQLVAVGLAILSLVGYITFLKLEVNHYRSNYQEALLELNSAKARESKLEEMNQGITKKYENSLAEANKLVEEKTKLIEEAIRNDKELAATRISLNAVRLFNKSKRDPSTTTPDPKQGDVSETNPTETPSDAAAVRIPQTVSLTDLFIVSAENDSNHWKCVKQVEDWQDFWVDYSQAVARVSN
jgi:hypothetical protein